jgi:predicted TIM-barrel fold metal-dependent hydrolase
VTQTSVATATLPETDIRSRYFLLSADCHVVEPPDLWERRVDKAFRHRLPRTEVDEKGQKWQVIEGHRSTRIADIKLEGEDLERSKAGSRDPEERLRDHARDGIDAEVIYPTFGLMMWASPDPELHKQMVRVYNDWGMEVFGNYRHIMAPAAAIAPRDVEWSVEEIRRVANMGYRHVMFPMQPGRSEDGRILGYNLPMFEPLWSAMEDANLPISLHVGTGKDPRTSGGNGGAVINYVWNALATAQEPVAQLCSSGVLERHPNLKFVTVEAGIGWVPWLLHAMDEGYHKHHMWSFPKLSMTPSEYWRRQGYATFQDDPIGTRLMDEYLGAGRLMWGNDYPHHEGTWPHSDEAIERTLGSLPETSRRAILGETAASLYGFEIPAKYRS